MDCRYHVYIDTMTSSSLEAAIEDECESFMTGINLKNEYPVTDIIIPKSDKINWNSYRLSKQRNEDLLRHVIMINDPKIVWAEFITDNELVKCRTIESEDPDENKLFLADFDANTGRVKIKCYGEGKEILFVTTVYFPRMENGRLICGGEPIWESSTRIRRIAYNDGIVNFIFNPWDVDSTHAYVMIDDMPVEYANSNGGTNMISLRNPGPDSVAMIIQIKDDSIVSWVKQKCPSNQSGRIISY